MDIQELRAAGKTNRQISAAMGRAHIQTVGRRYTEEERERLLELHADGQTCLEIARALGRNEGSVREKLRKIARGIDKNAAPWRRERAERAVQMKEEGKSNSEIADALNVTRQAVTLMFKRMRMRGDRARLEARRREIALTMLAAGQRTKDIARALDVSSAAVSQMFDRMGVDVPTRNKIRAAADIPLELASATAREAAHVR